MLIAFKDSHPFCGDNHLLIAADMVTTV